MCIIIIIRPLEFLCVEFDLYSFFSYSQFVACNLLFPAPLYPYRSHSLTTLAIVRRTFHNYKLQFIRFISFFFIYQIHYYSIVVALAQNSIKKTFAYDTLSLIVFHTVAHRRAMGLFHAFGFFIFLSSYILYILLFCFLRVINEMILKNFNYFSVIFFYYLNFFFHYC